MVQSYRDGELTHFQPIIEWHMPIVDALLCKYTCPRHDFDDLQEVAYYELVIAVKLAKDSLYDNNITPYIIRHVTYALVRYVSLDHLIVQPRTVFDTTSCTRVKMMDAADNTLGTVIDKLMLVDAMRDSIANDRQFRIVVYKLMNFKIKEIVDRMPGTYPMLIHREWVSFIERMDNAYTDI